MLRLTVFIAAAAVLTITGCAKQPAVVLKADAGQIGKGSMLSLSDTDGEITMLPTPTYPKGFSGKVVVTSGAGVERINPTGYMVEVEFSTNKLMLSFSVVGGAYICHTCAMLGLPVRWTAQ